MQGSGSAKRRLGRGGFRRRLLKGIDRPTGLDDCKWGGEATHRLLTVGCNVNCN